MSLPGIPRYTRITIDAHAPPAWRAMVWVANSHQRDSESTVHLCGPWNDDTTALPCPGPLLWFATDDDTVEALSHLPTCRCVWRPLDHASCPPVWWGLYFCTDV